MRHAAPLSVARCSVLGNREPSSGHLSHFRNEHFALLTASGWSPRADVIRADALERLALRL